MRILGRDVHDCENPWDGAPPWAVELGLIGLRILARMEPQMATKQTLGDLTKALDANTNATVAAKAALDHYAQVVADDAAKLAAAIADSDASDDPDVKAAIDTLTKNNADLAASTPQVATAVTNGTPAAGQPLV